MDSSTGQTRRRIFTHDGSNDAASRKDVPFFWEFFTLLSIWGSKTENPQFWGMNKRFQAKLAKSKNVHIIKTIDCIDSYQILYSDKDHQMPFVGGPHTRIINPRWRTASWKNQKKCDI